MYRRTLHRESAFCSHYESEVVEWFAGFALVNFLFLLKTFWQEREVLLGSVSKESEHFLYLRHTFFGVFSRPAGRSPLRRSLGFLLASKHFDSDSDSELRLSGRLIRERGR